MTRPNVLFVMTDQQRFDTIAALGNSHIRTPNLDGLVQRGVSFTRAYSTCPVCVPARHTIRTGCEPPTTRAFHNKVSPPVAGQADTMEGRCGPFLARTMRNLGYRTFGIGKFHTWPWDLDVGFDVHLHSEEMWGKEQRLQDAYAAFIRTQHPHCDWIEQLHGERSEMYYMPQMSPLPAALTVESWAADRAVELVGVSDTRPFFGFVSFIGPHPPFAPPLPFNRLYDPMQMPTPIKGDLAIDHMDEQIPWMNYLTWSDDVDEVRARVLKARYYGEITFIDQCLGRILDAVEARPDADNTLICFFSDHGDHLGDHHAWQKESFFEASCHVPMLLSWPAKLPANQRHDAIVCLTDLFAIATGAAGTLETRDGIDVLGLLDGKPRKTRERLIGLHGEPGSPQFKVMVLEGDWKYIYMANGRREQLFNLRDDPNELTLRLPERRDVADRLRAAAIEALRHPGAVNALDDGRQDLRGFDFEPRPLKRLLQMDGSRGVRGYGQC